MNNAVSTARQYTTKELCEQFGCSAHTILDNAKKCLPNKVFENGKQTYWTEQEVTVLLDCIKNNNNNHTDLARSLQGTTTAHA